MTNVYMRKKIKLCKEWSILAKAKKNAIKWKMPRFKEQD
jgi:hypothetical protein